jgi:triosephosphate isomerase (TIM)
MKVAVANFKAELNFSQARKWLADFKELLIANLPSTDKQIIVCPPFVFLPMFKQELENLPISIGSQDVSSFERGSYTGEITAEMLKHYCDFTLIGHSERRVYQHESSKQIQQKIDIANRFGLKVILCANKPEKYSGQIYALAYEPTSAIGSGIAADPQESWHKAKIITEQTPVNLSLYGGSVNSGNVTTFSAVGFSGVLVGKKSLEPTSFLAIADNL